MSLNCCLFLIYIIIYIYELVNVSACYGVTSYRICWAVSRANSV